MCVASVRTLQMEEMEPRRHEIAHLSHSSKSDRTRCSPSLKDTEHLCVLVHRSPRLSPSCPSPIALPGGGGQAHRARAAPSLRPLVLMGSLIPQTPCWSSRSSSSEVWVPCGTHYPVLCSRLPFNVHSSWFEPSPPFPASGKRLL